MKDLAGKAAVVTGGGSGIGEGIARALAREGCRVAVVDIIAKNAEAVAASICSEGGSAIGLSCDVSERSSVQAMKQAAERELGPISLAIANAGVSVFLPLIETTDADIDWQLQVNLHGVFHCLSTFLPDMVKAGEGHFVSTASLVGLLPFIPDHSPYVATKAGVVGMTLAMRAELAGSGVSLSVLCPGRVTTRISDSHKYRPERFGGPAGPVGIYPNPVNMPSKDPIDVGNMVVRGIRNDRPIILTDGTGRDGFIKGYADVVLAAFGDIVEWEKTHA